MWHVSNRSARKRTDTKTQNEERGKKKDFFPPHGGTFLLLKMLMRHSLKRAYLHDGRGEKKKITSKNEEAVEKPILLFSIHQRRSAVEIVFAKSCRER